MVGLRADYGEIVGRLRADCRQNMNTEVYIEFGYRFVKTY